MNNKEIVVNFFKLTFNDHQPRKAAELYIGDPYIQHNPHVTNGAPAFFEFFEDFFKQYPESFVEIKRAIAEDDFVVLHVIAKKNPEDLGEAVAEFFRLENGKIIEHWDVVSKIPNAAKNSNGVV